VKLTNTTYNMS